MKLRIIKYFTIAFITILFIKCINPMNQKVSKVQIDCSQIKAQLATVYAQDQDIRQDGIISAEDEIIDFKNLEIVVNIIEQCGFPKISQIDTIGVDAIFLTLQHSASNLYPKKYYNLLLEASQNGDLKKSTLALLEDRILMRDMKPQIYGTQIQDGKLYKLAYPEHVNERRDSVGLQPIEDYLAQFNIEFDVGKK